MAVAGAGVGAAVIGCAGADVVAVVSASVGVFAWVCAGAVGSVMSGASVVDAVADSLSNTGRALVAVAG